MQGRPISCLERAQIELRLKAHVSLRQIARDLKRRHRVIQYEVKANALRNGGYSAVYAQALADRRRRVRRAPPRKLDQDLLLQAHVITELTRGMSPDVISGRLRIDPPRHLRSRYISHESIYTWIQAGKGQAFGLYRFLCSGRLKRQKRGGRKTRKTHIPGRIPIQARPPEVDTRGGVGHWESDSVLFSKQRTRLSVQYERKSRYVLIQRLSNGTAEETEQALMRSIESLPLSIWKSITFDNGGEGARHGTLHSLFNIRTFFCDPFASWQKGGVENTNRLIRRYLPRHTDMASITQAELYAIQEQLNSTPRKILAYKTPKEVLAEAQEREVAH